MNFLGKRPLESTGAQISSAEMFDKDDEGEGRQGNADPEEYTEFGAAVLQERDLV